MQRALSKAANPDRGERNEERLDDPKLVMASERTTKGDASRFWFYLKMRLNSASPSILAVNGMVATSSSSLGIPVRGPRTSW